MTVIGAGLVTVDIIQKVNTGWTPVPGAPAYSSGGTVCNILCHLGHAGWNTQIIGTVGGDRLGELLLADLTSYGVDCSGLVKDQQVQTRRILHKIVVEGRDLGKHKFELMCSKCRKPFPPVNPPTLDQVAPAIRGGLGKCTVLVVDRANELTASLVDAVCAAGGLTVFEPGYLSGRSPQYVDRILQKIDVLKYSHELYWKGQHFSRVLQHEPPARARVVIETRGANGVQIVCGNRRKRLGGRPLAGSRDRDRTGAGVHGG